MLDLIGTLFVGTTTAVVLAVVSSTLAHQLRARIVIAALVGAWIAVGAGAAAAGAFDAEASVRGPLLLMVVFGLPLVLTAGLALFVPAVRATLLGVPMALLIGLNVFRAGGALFLFLAANGRLAGPFPYSAGWGDIVTGVLALPLMLIANRPPDVHRRLRTASIAAWNAFGMLDLVMAVFLGVVSADGSPLQLIHAGVGSAAITHLPWSMVPTFLVPFFLITHAIVFAQLRSRAVSSGRYRLQPLTSVTPGSMLPGQP